jgi:uncharacterized protein involved in exopolysaccharide biosynthesis
MTHHTPTERELTPTTDVESVELHTDSASPTNPTGAFLLVIAGQRPGRVFPLNGTVRTIGRSSRADIRLDQQSVSHEHAKLVQHAGRYLLTDLGSTNGTFVNDQSIHGELELSAGDTIRVGETILSYLAPQSEELPTVALEHVSAEIVRTRQQPVSLPREVPRTAFGSRPEIEVRALDEGPSLRSFVWRVVGFARFMRSHLALFVVLTSVAAAAGVASVFAMPPPTTAAFEVRLTPKTAQNPVHQFERANVEFFTSAETNFRSPELVRQTLEALGEKGPQRAAVAQARDRLKFDSVGLQTYRGSYSDPAPNRAVQFLETHVNLYLDTEIDKTLKVIRAEVDFLKGQLGQNERELSRIESELKSFKEQHIDGLPDQSKEQFTSRLALRTRQSELAGQVERLTLELDLARRRLQSEDPLLERKASSAETNQSALAETNRKLAEARASGLGTGHPEVQRLQKQASELERLSREAPVTDPTAAERLGGPVLKEMRNRVLELEVQRTAAQKELGRVSALLGDVDRAVRSLPEVEARYAELTRSYDSTKAIRDKLFEQFKASELQVELERASAAARYEILMAPEVVDRSLRKAAALRVAIGAFLGFLLALLIAGALELRRYLRHMA